MSNFSHFAILSTSTFHCCGTSLSAHVAY